MKKRKISILLLSNIKYDGLGSFIKTIALFLFLFSLLVNLSCEKQEKIERPFEVYELNLVHASSQFHHGTHFVHGR